MLPAVVVHSIICCVALLYVLFLWEQENTSEPLAPTGNVFLFMQVSFFSLFLKAFSPDLCLLQMQNLKAEVLLHQKFDLQLILL